MEDPEHASHATSRVRATGIRWQKSGWQKSNVNSRRSNTSATHSFARNEASREDNSRMNTSGNDQSNYFNSMLSDKGLSRLDLDEHRWLRKSASEESQEASFDPDSTLPDKLATRLRTLIENDAKRGSLQNSDDELLALSPQRRILERGKEIVRKSGYDMDFTGQLVSKDEAQQTFDNPPPQPQFQTSLDLDISQENRFWLDQSLGNNGSPEQAPEGAPRAEVSPEVPGKRGSSGNDIQGITSTKYSDLYCQDNFEDLEKRKAKPEEADLAESGEVKTQNKPQAQAQGGDSSGQMDDMKTFQKPGTGGREDSLGEGGHRKREAETERRTSEQRGLSVDRSELDMFENGSFINIVDNNSSVVPGDLENNPLYNSVDRWI